MSGSYRGPEPIATESGDWQCGAEGCERTFPTEQGTKAHWSREHAAPTINGADANEIFAKIAKATQALFPDPTEVYMRLEEIADLRKHMARVLNRGHRG